MDRVRPPSLNLSRTGGATPDLSAADELAVRAALREALGARADADGVAMLYSKELAQFYAMLPDAEKKVIIKGGVLSDDHKETIRTCFSKMFPSVQPASGPILKKEPREPRSRRKPNTSRHVNTPRKTGGREGGKKTTRHVRMATVETTSASKSAHKKTRRRTAEKLGELLDLTVTPSELERRRQAIEALRAEGGPLYKKPDERVATFIKFARDREVNLSDQAALAALCEEWQDIGKSGNTFGHGRTMLTHAVEDGDVKKMSRFLVAADPNMCLHPALSLELISKTYLDAIANAQKIREEISRIDFHLSSAPAPEGANKLRKRKEELLKRLRIDPATQFLEQFNRAWPLDGRHGGAAMSAITRSVVCKEKGPFKAILLWVKNDPVNRGPRLNIWDFNGMTPLTACIRFLCNFGESREARRRAASLLKAGADVNMIDARGETALIAALTSGDRALIDFLLDSGAKISPVKATILAAQGRKPPDPGLVIELIERMLAESQEEIGYAPFFKSVVQTLLTCRDESAFDEEKARLNKMLQHVLKQGLAKGIDLAASLRTKPSDEQPDPALPEAVQLFAASLRPKTPEQPDLALQGDITSELAPMLSEAIEALSDPRAAPASALEAYFRVITVCRVLGWGEGLNFLSDAVLQKTAALPDRWKKIARSGLSAESLSELANVLLVLHGLWEFSLGQEGQPEQAGKLLSKVDRLLGALEGIALGQVEILSDLAFLWSAAFRKSSPEDREMLKTLVTANERLRSALKSAAGARHGMLLEDTPKYGALLKLPVGRVPLLRAYDVLTTPTLVKILAKHLPVLLPLAIALSAAGDDDWLDELRRLWGVLPGAHGLVRLAMGRDDVWMLDCLGGG